MIIRYLILIAGSYILYKILRKSVYSLINNYLKPKELATPKLTKCSNCDIYIDDTTAIIKKNKEFCSKNCEQQYFSDES